MAKAPDYKRAAKLLGEHVDKYHLSLGRFVSAFSLVEATLLRVLWTLAHLQAPYAQAVLSGVRIEGAMSLINRIADAEHWPAETRAKWKAVFDQLGIINKLRNDLLHHGAMMHGDVWLVSNRPVAHHEDRIREIQITPATLDDARVDLEYIHLHLIVLGGPGTGIYVATPVRALNRKLQRYAWRYKSPPRADWGQMTPSIPRKRQRQQKPSPK